jgi:hypothetical protein
MKKPSHDFRRADLTSLYTCAPTIHAFDISQNFKCKFIITPHMLSISQFLRERRHLNLSENVSCATIIFHAIDV